MFLSGSDGFLGAVPTAQTIALVLHDFSSGGSERVAIRLANTWVAAGRDVTLYCGTEEGPLRRLVAPQIAVVPIGAGIARGAGFHRRLGRALAQAIRARCPDVVVGPGNYHAPILRAMLAHLDRDRPAVVCKLSNPIMRGDRGRIAQAVFNARFDRLTRPFDRLVAMSPALAAEATILLRREDIACVGEPSLDALPLAAPLRASTGTVVCVGRLTRQKNFALALDAFARVDPALRLVVLGEGEEEGMLKARAAGLGIADRVTFAGFVHDVPDHLSRADALLCTSLFEGYPANLVEAIAAGIPVVATPCSVALPEILFDRSFGDIVRARADDIAATLTAVLGERRRPAALPLGQLGRRHQRAACARDWLEVLDDAVAVRLRAMASVQ